MLIGCLLNQVWLESAGQVTVVRCAVDFVGEERYSSGEFWSFSAYSRSSSVYF